MDEAGVTEGNFYFHLTMSVILITSSALQNYPKQVNRSTVVSYYGIPPHITRLISFRSNNSINSKLRQAMLC